MKHPVYEAQNIVVGTGPGGATVARELSRRGEGVLILEKGRFHRFKGNHISALFYTDRMGFFYTEEGLNIIRGIGVGGSSILYCGCSADPPEWLKTKYHLDIEREAEETKKELNVKPLDEKYLGEGSRRIMESALGLGLKWEPVPKFMDPSRCRRGFSCSSSCMTGCSCGAKWTSEEWVREAVNNGAKILTSAEVDSLIVRSGECLGVKGYISGKYFEARAERVFLCAGGIGTAIILQKSGFPSAGQNFSIDPTIIVYGRQNYLRGNFYDPPMSVGSYEFEKDGFMLASLTDTWLTFPIQAFSKGILKAIKAFYKRNVLGIMVKTKDELAGSINVLGEVSKPLTDGDRRRMNYGATVAREILINAGCHPSTIFISPVRGTHPQGTARLGELVDENGRLRGFKNCFVLDASVIPEALARPMVLTIISMAKRAVRSFTG